MRKRGYGPKPERPARPPALTSSLSDTELVLDEGTLQTKGSIDSRKVILTQERDPVTIKTLGTTSLDVDGNGKRRFLICGVRPKLVVTMVIIGVAAIVTTAALSYSIAATRIRDQTADSLMLVSNGRVNLVKAYIEDIERELQLFSITQNVTSAVSDFIASVEEMRNGSITLPSETALKSLAEGVSASYRQLIDSRPEVEREELSLHLGLKSSDLVPQQWWAQALQQRFVFGKNLSEDVEAAVGNYTMLKSSYDQTFQHFIQRKLFSSVMIMTLDGAIVYSFPSRVDLFSNVTTGAYAKVWYPDVQSGKESPLATVIKEQERDRLYRSDFWLYFPAGMKAEAYFSYQPSKQPAIIVVSVSADSLNQFMSKQEGPQGVSFVEWKTFDAFIVGSTDGRLRTESALFANASIEDQSDFLRLSGEQGTSQDDLQRMHAYNSSIFYQRAWTKSEAQPDLGVEGDSNLGRSAQLDDFRGIGVQAYLEEISLPTATKQPEAQDWTLVCKIDTSEALKELNDMRRNIAYVCVACVVFITACTIALSTLLLHPLIVIQGGMDHFANGDFAFEIRVKTKDEMEKLSEAANDMAKALMATTVSRSYVNNILQSMSEALLVFKIERDAPEKLIFPGLNTKKKLGSGLDLTRSSFVKRLSLEDARVKMVNSAACELFGYSEEEIVRTSINTLFPDLKELEARHRRGLIGLETSILHCSGKLVPVLFSGALMNDNEGGEVVVIIRDITKIKSLEARHKFMREAFGRYVTDDVVEKLLDSPEGLKLGGEWRRVTILMSDLRGFTALSSRLRPEQVVSFLNRYLERMLEIIYAHGGVVDEIIGDGMQVIFGAPISKADDAQRAVACAVAMQSAMAGVNRLNQQDGLSEIEMGIGIHTGDAIAGNIGSLKRAKYGVVGNTVSIASKIESYTTGNQILISHSTYKEAKVVEVESASEVSLDEHGIGTLHLYNVTGVGGRYRRSFVRAADPLRELSPALPIKYFHITDKIVGQVSEYAEITKVSKMSLFLRASTEFPPILTNLKISSLKLPDPLPPFCTRSSDGYVDVDLYVKVSRHEGGGGASATSASGFCVSITSLDREWRELLLQLAKHRHRKASADRT